MNARQKLKRLKKAYEILLKQPVKQYVVRHPVDTLHLKRRYPLEMVNCFSKEGFERRVRNDMKQVLMDKIEPYIDWRLDEDIENDCYLLDFQLKVVSRNKEISSLADGVKTPLIKVERG
jgi:hypothetical protein